MKALVIDYFLPDNAYTYELVKELQDITDVTFLCRKNAGDDLQIKDLKKRLYIDGTNKLIAPFAYAMNLATIRSYVYSNKYDVIHVQTFKESKYEIPIYLSKKRKAPLVHTVHNVLPHESSPSDKAMYKEFYEACDGLITHNEYSKKILVQEFGLDESRIHVIPHGIYGASAGAAGSRAESKSDKTTFLMFGLVREYKGVDILLKAVALLPADVRAKAEFIIAGKQYKNIDDRDYEQLAKELGIEDCVRFRLERIPDEDIEPLFSRADACLFPYRNIYGSGAMLMAYTYNKPVIASDIPAFCEETEEGSTGLLFESESPESLAGAITEFMDLSEEERSSYSGKIERLTAEKYNWKLSAQKTLEVYQKLVF